MIYLGKAINDYRGWIEMKIYHGSNVEVREPQLLAGRTALDFGQAFYMTTDYEQARKWAQLISKRRKSISPIVNEFDFDETKLNELSVLVFEKADRNWLEFISCCRTSKKQMNEYDLIIGPVANDQTFSVIQLYLVGAYDEDEALRRLLPYKLKNQYAFKTEKALSCLSFTRAVFV